MADDDKGEDTSIHGADWEVVSLTASAYAASPGPKPFDLPVESNEDINKEEQVSSAEMFLSNHFVFPPHEHKNLMIEPDCCEIHDEPGSKGASLAEDELSGILKSDEDTWKLKSDDGQHEIEFFDMGEDLSHHGIEFREGKAFEELQPDIYVDSTFNVFHAKTDISLSVFCNESSGNSEPNDLSHRYMYPSDGTGASKLNEEHKFDGPGLPCEAWWKRHAMSIYNHAKGAYQFWSVFVAAAVMGFAILGQQWQREKLQLQQLKWFAISDENWSRMVGPMSRFKDMLVGGHQRNLLIRGGAASNH